MNTKEESVIEENPSLGKEDKEDDLAPPIAKSNVLSKYPSPLHK